MPVDSISNWLLHQLQLPTYGPVHIHFSPFNSTSNLLHTASIQTKEKQIKTKQREATNESSSADNHMVQIVNIFLSMRPTA